MHSESHLPKLGGDMLESHVAIVRGELRCMKVLSRSVRESYCFDDSRASISERS